MNKASRSAVALLQFAVAWLPVHAASDDESAEVRIELLSHNAYVTRHTPKVELSLRVFNKSDGLIKMGRCESTGIDDKSFRYADSTDLRISVPSGSSGAARVVLNARNTSNAIDSSPGRMIEFNLQCSYDRAQGNRFVDSRTAYFRLVPGSPLNSSRSAGDAVLSGIGSVLGGVSGSENQRNRAMTTGALDILGAVISSGAAKPAEGRVDE